MKIGVFAYNFEHKKTQEGLLRLFLAGYKVDVVMAADPVELKFYQSKIRVGSKGLKYVHPKKVCEKLGVPYHVVPHNSKECVELIKEYGLDVGIILGARILKGQTIDAFKNGVINMHPGMIPENRGLDNVKWAVLKGYKQGVTVHFINEKIDDGEIIMQKEIDVFKDDTLVDIFLRIQNLEQEMMIEVLDLLKKGKAKYKKNNDTGNYYKAVPEDLEKDLMDKFEEYKKNFGK